MYGNSNDGSLQNVWGSKNRGKVQISNITKCMGIESEVNFAMTRG